MPAPDTALPAADILLGDGAAAALAPAVERDGGTVREVALRQVEYLPGERFVASYEGVVEWPGGPQPELLGVSVFADGETTGERTTEIAGMPADVWRYPDDPALRGLPEAITSSFVAPLLQQLGVPAGAVVAVRGYAARSRAVIEVLSPPAKGKLVFRPGQGFGEAAPVSRMFFKLVRPEQVDRLVAAHEAFADLLPVARLLHVDRERGLLVASTLPGVPFWSCLVDGADGLPGPAALVELLDRIRDVPMEAEARMPSTRSVQLTLRTLAALLPDQADALARFEERLGEAAPQPEITIHGDFHEVQLLVSGGVVTGVIDLDDAGRGHRIDDLAMLLGRLYAYGRAEPKVADRVDAYVANALLEWRDEVDPLELRRRMCAVAMNHALLPFRFQEPDWPARCSNGIAVAAQLQDQMLPG